MGGPGGHMDHPFDLPQVKTGQDLIEVFEAAALEVQQNPAAIKIDGSNVSFKLVKKPGGYEFVGDRGSLNPTDIEGFTIDNLSLAPGEPTISPETGEEIPQRFKSGISPETGEEIPHGQAKQYRDILSMMNELLSTGQISSELSELGMDKDPSLFFNTEYVSGQTNVTSYDGNFIAIHGLNRFYQKTPFRGGGPPRPGAPRPPGVKNSVPGYEVRSSQNDPSMINIVKKLQPIAEKYNFKVYGTIPSYTTGEPDFENTLNTEFSVNLARHPETGEVVSRTQSLRRWLEEATHPGKEQTVALTDGRNPPTPGKFVYGAILEGSLITELLAEGENWWSEICSANPECAPDGDVKKAIDGAVLYHATRLLGNDIFEVLFTDAMGVEGQSVKEHEGLVLRNPAVFGPKPVKITGEFLWKGWKESAFGAQKESLKLVNEELDSRGCQRMFAVVPGAFKPPHKGHYAMVKKYSEQLSPGGDVIVYISRIDASERKGFNPETQANVSPAQAKAMWDIYTKALSNVTVAIIPEGYKTPVQAAYEFVGANGPTQAGDCVFMGASTKDGDDQRFKFDLQKHANEGVSVRSLPVTPLGDLSATQFREAIKIGDTKTISNIFLPTEAISPEEEIIIYDILGIETQPNDALQELLSQLINEQQEPMPEWDEQKEIDDLLGTTKTSYESGQNRERWLRKLQDQGQSEEEAIQSYEGAGGVLDRIKSNIDTLNIKNEPVTATDPRISSASAIYDQDSQTITLNKPVWSQRNPEDKRFTLSHELAHAIERPLDVASDYKQKFEDIFGGTSPARYLSDEEKYAEVKAFQTQIGALDRKVTVDDVKDLCGGSVRSHGRFRKYLNRKCQDPANYEQMASDIDDIAKVEPATPAGQPEQMVAESEFQRKMKANLSGEMKWLLDNGPQDPGTAYSTKRVGGKSNAFLAKEEKQELDEISSMAGGSVEGSMASGGKPGGKAGPWQHMNVEEENEKQKQNAKISHGTPLVEEDELVEQVLNYLLKKIGE